MRSLAHASMSENSSAPHSTEHTAIVISSDRSYRTCRELRGSDIETNTYMSSIAGPTATGLPRTSRSPLPNINKG